MTVVKQTHQKIRCIKRHLTNFPFIPPPFFFNLNKLSIDVLRITCILSCLVER